MAEAKIARELLEVLQHLQEISQRFTEVLAQPNGSKLLEQLGLDTPLVQREGRRTQCMLIVLSNIWWCLSAARKSCRTQEQITAYVSR